MNKQSSRNGRDLMSVGGVVPAGLSVGSPRNILKGRSLPTVLVSLFNLRYFRTTCDYIRCPLV